MTTLKELYPTEHLSQRLSAEEPLSIPDFREVETQLNSVRDRIDGLSDWSKRRHRFAQFHSMRDFVETRYGAQNVNNAWFKYYELVQQYQLLPTNGVIFFNAEFPGGGLSGVHHYARTHCPKMDFRWRASSLRSGSGLGDYYGLWKHNPENWLMNDKNDGDCTKLNNILDFEKRLTNKLVSLYFHDAGLDSSERYNQQEEDNLLLHHGCLTTGLLVLRAGGSLVVKSYSYFKPLTQSQLLLCRSLFSEFYVVKPVTSRPVNSEMYWVGKGYKGLSNEIREILLQKLERFDETPLRGFEGGLPQSAVTFQNDLVRRQIGILEIMTSPQWESVAVDKKAQLRWLEKYPIRVLKPGDRLRCEKPLKTGRKK